jgi:hypothetical protein
LSVIEQRRCRWHVLPMQAKLVELTVADKARIGAVLEKAVS